MRVVIAMLLGCTLGTQQLLAQATSPGTQADPLSQAMRSAWNGAKLNLRESAEQMPEADYNFKPVDAVRTFGQVIAHVAGSNYEYCSLAKGEKTPFTEDAFEKSAKTKADVVKAITDAIAYCDAGLRHPDRRGPCPDGLGARAVRVRSRASVRSSATSRTLRNIMAIW